MKPVIFDLRGVKFSVASGVLVNVNSDGELSFDEIGAGGLVWPTPIKSHKLSDMLGGLERGSVARDIIPKNFPVGKIKQVVAGTDSAIRHAGYAHGMKLKIKEIGKNTFEVQRV